MSVGEGCNDENAVKANYPEHGFETKLSEVAQSCNVEVQF